MNTKARTLSPMTLRKIRALRERNPFDPMPISQAYHQALVAARKPSVRSSQAFLLKLEANPGSSVTTRVGGPDGPQITVRVVLDEDGNTGEDYVTGRFTNKRSDTTVLNPARGWSNHFTYYEPSGLMVKEKTIDTYRARGMSAATAFLARQREIAIDANFDNEIIYLGVEVEVRVGGGQSGVGESLWGIGSHPSEGHAYIIETAADLVTSAVSQFLKQAPEFVAKSAQHTVDLINAQSVLAALSDTSKE